MFCLAITLLQSASVFSLLEDEADYEKVFLSIRKSRIEEREIWEKVWRKIEMNKSERENQCQANRRRQLNMSSLV